MANKISLLNTSSIEQREGIQSRILEIILKDYGVKKRHITVRNHQANSMIERIHQTIGNIMRLFEVHSTDTNEKDPWTGIPSAIRFATGATVHTTMQATPMQLAFGKDAILNVKHEADWNYIKQRREELIRNNNEQESKKRKTHNYYIGDKVLLKGNRATKWNQCIQCIISNKTN
eukprot:12949383-Ditylum_brightwellii.AAC.1